MTDLASAPAVNGKSSLATASERQGMPLTAAPERLGSLDAFRGFVMLWIIGGEGLMAGLAALGHNRVVEAIVYQLIHTPWQGLRFYDCIWPSFMLMVGVSVPLSFAKRSLAETYHQQLAHAAKRAIVLFLLGSLRESVSMGSISDRIEQRPAADRDCLFRGSFSSAKILALPSCSSRGDTRWLWVGLGSHPCSRRTRR